MEITTQTPSLRIFRRLDTELLSEEFISKVGDEEGDYEYVDGDRARDFAWTEEIMAATIGAALVDADGNVLHEFEGPNALAQAEKARGSAKITFAIDFDTPEADDEAPKRSRAGSTARAAVTA